MAEISENVFMAERLKELKDLILRETNDQILGAEIRKII